MKKYAPYALPLAVLAVVFFLVFRWYNNQRVSLPPKDKLISEGVQIEDLTQEETSPVWSGAGDYQSLELEHAEDGYFGNVRFMVEDDKVIFAVSADLPDLKSGSYEVWLKEVNGTAMRKAFSLVPDKGGYMGAGSLPAELLPLELLISTSEDEKTIDTSALLRGIINAPDKE